MNLLVLRLVLPLVLLAAARALAAQDQPEVLVELDRNRIYEGESVHYRVILNHVQNPAPPKLADFDDFDVSPRGERSLNSRSVTIINGRMTAIVRYGRAYDYMLTPRRTGTLRIPPPVAEVDGKLLKGQARTLLVVAPGQQDVAILEIFSNHDSVYPMQPFAITLNVAVKELPAPASNRNPLAVQPKPPTLSIPWVDDDQLANGLVPAVGWQRWIGLLQSRGRAGFGINNLGNRSVFSLFDNRTTTFLPPHRPTRRKDRSGAEAGYWEFTIEREFTASRVGTFRFGPVTLKGTFATHLGAGERLAGEDIFAVGQPVVVTVKDVPLAGRPDSYIGAVGHFKVAAELAPTQVKVGDPMTLTLTVRGAGTLQNATAPDLNSVAEVAEQFKVYDATAETRDGAKCFTYSLRPLRVETAAFPSLAVSYFDVEQEKYTTLHTKAIPIQVSPAEQLRDTEIASAAAPAAADRAIEVRTEGLFANIADLSALADQSVRPERWALGLTGLAGLYAAIVLATHQLRRLGNNQQRTRRRRAAARARQRLGDALAEVDAGRLRDAADHLRAALVGLVADIAGAPEAGLTSTDARQQLAALGVGEPLTNRLGQLLEACDGARYGASDGALQGLGDEAQALLADLLKALRRKKLLS